MTDAQPAPGPEQLDRPVQAEAEQRATSVDRTSGHLSHGNSVAAWTAVAIIMLGCLVMSVAVAATLVWLFVVGAVVVVAGAVTGRVLTAMGFGASGRPGH